MAEYPTHNPSKTSRTAINLGFWSAILATLFTVLFIALALVYSPGGWSGIDAYAKNFNFLQMTNFIPVILLAPTVIVLMACIHSIAPEAKRVLSLVGIAFSSVYAAIVCTNYYLQLYVVHLNLQSSALEGLTLLAQPNFHSVFFALETIGYAFLSLATIMVSPTFIGGKLESWIRWLFVISGALGIFGVLAAPFDQPYLIFAGLGLWSLTFPASTLLMAIYFRRAQR